MNAHEVLEKLVLAMAGALLIVGSTLAGTVQNLNTFNDGDLISATPMNDNFANVKSAVDDNAAAIANQRFISLNIYGATLGGVASFSIGSGQFAGLLLDEVTGGSFAMGFVLPPDYMAGNPITVRIVWHTAAVSCDILLGPNFLSVGRPGITHITGSTATAGLSATNGSNLLNAPAIANESGEKLYSITSPDGVNELIPGDSVIFGLSRGAGFPDDTCANDLVIQALSVTY